MTFREFGNKKPGRYAAGEGAGGHVPAVRFQWTAVGGLVAMQVPAMILPAPPPGLEDESRRSREQ